MKKRKEHTPHYFFYRENKGAFFHTLSMKVDLEKAINSYTVKKISQQFMVNSVKSFNPQKINFYSYEKTDNKLLIKGTINFGDENEHIFETLLPAFELLSNNLTL